jgi:hypothetical protein
MKDIHLPPAYFTTKPLALIGDVRLCSVGCKTGNTSSFWMHTQEKTKD